MTAKERILALRLLEKQKQQPEYAKRIGIQVNIIMKDPKKEYLLDRKNVRVIPSGEERGNFMGTAGIVCLLLYIPVAILFGLVDKYK